MTCSRWIRIAAPVLAAAGLCQADVTAPAAPASAAAAAAAAPADVRFPREIKGAAGSVIVHAPQIDAWPDYERIEGRAALEGTLNGRTKPAIGSLTFTAKTVADVAAHTVTIYDIDVNETQFPTASAADQKALEALIRSAVRQTPQKMPLDVVVRQLADAVIPAGAAGLASTPPVIFYSSEPAILVNIDGEPIRVPVEKTKLSYAANTNWDLYYHSGESRWYLLHDRQWLRTAAKSSVAGPWELATKLPRDFNKLPDDDNFRATLAQNPPTVLTGAIPRVYVSIKPAELIATRGDPDLVAIPGTTLSYVDDTDSDVFKLGNDWYYLVSGRWFTAQNLSGPWSSVTKLPATFGDIPASHPRGDVRVAVPGTEEARLAVLEADIPRKAEIRKTATPGIEVKYNGAPQFEQIGNLPVFRATNSAYDVLRVGTVHYLCYNAVWWASSAPTGPWVVATSVPQEIYQVPPSSPAYPCTYVHVYASSEDSDTVTTGYSAGYTGAFVFGVSLAYGTGYYYPPYYYGGGYYPVYWPYPPSYGRNAWYNPATGNYGGAEAIYGPYGGAGRAAVYNPETGTYGRANAVWDHDEFAASAAAYNPRTGTGVATNRYRNEDGAWGQSLVTRNDNWVATQSHFENGQGTVDFATSKGGSGTTTVDRNGNTINTSTEASRGDKSITSQGQFTKEGGQGSFETSGGASGEYSRDFGNGQVSGSSEVTKGDKTMTSEVVRGEQGSARQISGSGGEEATIAYDRSEGDLYAARDGTVYKRNDDGSWSQNSGNGWTPADANRPEGGTTRTQGSGQAATQGARTGGGAAGAAGAGAKQNLDLSMPEMRPEYSTPRASASPSSMGGGASSMGGRTDYPSTRPGYDSMGSSRQLERDYSARRDGYSNYNQRRTTPQAPRRRR
jgi:hypothetical protein